MRTPGSHVRQLLARYATRAAERLIGGRHFLELPPGVDLAYDIRRYLPKTAPRTIFDVGASVGQSALAFVRSYPDAAVYCFEPVTSTFDQLRSSLRGHANVTCHRVAMSSAPGEGAMRLERYSVLNRLEETEPASGRAERVTLDTVADFCARRGIAHIDLLKVDTEGHDLHVLRGAAAMLAEHAIDLVQVEAGMNPRNRLHVPFEAFKSYLEPLGYFLFRVYDQVGEWPTSDPSLRRTNPVFVSGTAIEANRGAG
jgi:FkbM family methyltransferase